MLSKPTAIPNATQLYIPVCGSIRLKKSKLVNAAYIAGGVFLLLLLTLCFLYPISVFAFANSKDLRSLFANESQPSIHKQHVAVEPKAVKVATSQPVATPVPISPEEQAIAKYIKTVNKKASDVYALSLAKNAMLYGKAHNHDPLLLVALMKVESGFKNNAASNAGAKGLTQVIPKYHTAAMKNCGGYDLHNIQIGICTGSKVLREYIAQTGSLETALAVYNGGFGNPQYAYSDSVIDAYRTVVRTVGKST